MAVITPAHADNDGISKQRAAEIATQAYPGRVLGVKRKSDTFNVKTLSDNGKVRVIKVDAKSGTIVSGSKTNNGR
jgi:uncharacterized membrane protein YkoI